MKSTQYMYLFPLCAFCTFSRSLCSEEPFKVSQLCLLNHPVLHIINDWKMSFRPSFSDYIIFITYFQTRLHQILNIHHIQSLWATRKPSSIWGTFTRLQNKHFSVGFNCSWRDHSRTPECCLRLSMERGEGSINRDFVKRVGAECGEGLSDIGNRVTDGVADTVLQDSWE